MKTRLLPLLLLSGVALLGSSCVYNDPTENPDCGRFLEARAWDGNNAQIHNVGIYLYNSSGLLIGYHHTEVATPIRIDAYRTYGQIQVVAWGNALGDPTAQKLSDPVLGSAMADHRLTQNKAEGSFAGSALTAAPSDLFHGTLQIDFDQSVGAVDTVATVYLKRVVSSYILTVKNLARAFGPPDGSYHILVRHPNAGLDFVGNLIPGNSVYMPDVHYDPGTDQLTTSIGMALPTGTGYLTIELYSGDKLCYTATLDRDGNIIALQTNTLHNILLDFERAGWVEVIPSEWGKAWIDQGFS